MSEGHDQVRSYGGWRRSRSVGLLGLGPAGTLVLLGCFAGLLLLAALSLKTLLYAGPPAAVVGTGAAVRGAGAPLAHVGAPRRRWPTCAQAAYTRDRAHV